MSEHRDIPGRWWIPSNPEQKWTGKLRLSPKKSPRLKLLIPEGLYIRVPEIPEVLHGCDKNGNPITLLYASCSSKTMSGAIAQIKCSAGYAILGIHIAKPEEFKAHKLTLRVQYLFDWLNRSGFKLRETVGYESKIHHALPDLLEFEVNPDLRMEFASTSSHKSAYRFESISEDVAVTFESSSGFSIPDCHELVSAVRHLLHFSILRRVHQITLTCRINGVGMQVGEDFFHDSIEFVSRSDHEEAPDEKFSDRLIFQFADVEKDFGTLFQKWMQFLKDFHEVAGCYFSTIYHSLPPEIEHLCLTQALEAYHGVKNGSHAARGIKNKIEELINAHHATFPSVFPDVKDFAGIVRDIRNYYAHHNPEDLRTGRIVERSELCRLNLKLSLLMQACILTELGIPTDRHRRLQRQLDVHFIEYT